MPPAPAPPDFAPLRTERLSLRVLREGDAAALHRLVNDWEVAKTLARVPFPYPRSLADEWIASTWAQIAAGEAWHLAVAGADDALLGCAGLSLDRRGERAELGYWIGRPHWGKRHTLTRADVDAMYPAAERFRATRRAADPEGKFLNAHLEALFE